MMRVRVKISAAYGSDLETAWSIARLRLKPDQIQELWPGEKKVVGSGLRLVAVDLDDGTSVVYDATVAKTPIRSMWHTKGATGPGKWGPELHRLSAVE